MKIGVSVTCFERIDCVARCISSILSNIELNPWDLRIFQDAHSRDNEILLERYLGFINTSVDVVKAPEKRLYGCRNILRSMRIMFDLGYDVVIRFDSDTIVSPYIVHSMIKAIDSTSGGVIISPISCEMSFLEKLNVQGVLHRDGFPTGTNMAITKESWKAVSLDVDEYEKSFLMCGPELRDNASAVKHLSELASRSNHPHVNHFKNNNWGTGSDSIMHCSLVANNVPFFQFAANRVVHRSNIGENVGEKENSILMRTELDVFPMDATRGGFVVA